MKTEHLQPSLLTKGIKKVKQKRAKEKEATKENNPVPKRRMEKDVSQSLILREKPHVEIQDALKALGYHDKLKPHREESLLIETSDATISEIADNNRLRALNFQRHL